MSAEPETRFPSTAERRRRNRQEMTAAILDAAREVMREQGVGALNLNEVARRIGVKTPSLYEYFPGKAALYDALFRLGCELFAAHMEPVMAQSLEPWKRLEAAIEGYMTFAQTFPELWALVFGRPVPGFEPSEESMRLSREILGRAQRAMLEMITSGAIRPGLSPEQATDFLNAVIHGLAAAHMANEPHLSVGSGRFGSLIPATILFFQAAWGGQANSNRYQERDDAGPSDTTPATANDPL